MAFKVFVVLLSISTPIAGLELFFRYTAFCCPEPQAFPTAMQEAWFARYDFRNSMGFRDIEHQPISTTPRLAVVGDSFAYGWGINRIEDRYGEQLAAMLGWESVNASIPDTDTMDHIDLLEKILPLKPRVVVLLYVFNDINYLNPEPRWPAIPLRPLFYRSHLFQQLVVRFKGHLSSPDFSDGYKDPATLTRHVADLKRFTDRASNAEAVVAVVPFIRMRGDDGHYAALIEAARSAGVPVWPIKRNLDRFPISDLILNSLDNHPNPFAFKIAAEATLPYLSNYK